MAPDDRRYRLLGWAALWFTVVVILGGSVVRASGSGDGCGATWPRCEGSILPIGGSTETIIEFTHRALSLLLGAVLVTFVVWTWRRTRPGDPVRRWLGAAAVFFIGEVLIGALLVVYGWVDQDDSLGRLVVVPIHLVNTFFLLAALTGAAHHAGRERPSVRRTSLSPVALTALAVVLVVAASGALNALADTLYPARSLSEGLAADVDAASPLLVRLRVIHPLLAMVGGLAVVWLVRHPSFDPRGNVRRLVAAITAVVFGQFAVGILNVALVTPLELQVVHLLVADVLWILLVLAALGASRVGAAVAPDDVLVS